MAEHPPSVNAAAQHHPAVTTGLKGGQEGDANALAHAHFVLAGMMGEPFSMVFYPGLLIGPIRNRARFVRMAARMNHALQSADGG